LKFEVAYGHILRGAATRRPSWPPNTRWVFRNGQIREQSVEQSGRTVFSKEALVDRVKIEDMSSEDWEIVEETHDQD
jgi:hypothetical protein